MWHSTGGGALYGVRRDFSGPDGLFCPSAGIELCNFACLVLGGAGHFWPGDLSGLAW